MEDTVMTRKDIIKEMEVRGYKAVEREIVKNGVVFEAICVQLDKQAGVLLYPQKQIECAEKTNQSIGEVVNELLKEVEAARNEKPSLSQVPDRAFMKSHVYVALQKDSMEKLERKRVRMRALKSICIFGMEITVQKSLPI